MKFKHVLEYNHWTSSSTNDDMVAHNKDTEGVDFDYVSKIKFYMVQGLLKLLTH